MKKRVVLHKKKTFWTSFNKKLFIILGILVLFGVLAFFILSGNGIIGNVISTASPTPSPITNTNANIALFNTAVEIQNPKLAQLVNNPAAKASGIVSYFTKVGSDGLRTAYKRYPLNGVYGCPHVANKLVTVMIGGKTTIAYQTNSGGKVARECDCAKGKPDRDLDGNPDGTDPDSSGQINDISSTKCPSLAASPIATRTPTPTPF